MMNYEIFKEVVKEKFMDFLPEQFQDMELVVNPTEKVNQTVDGLTLMGEGVSVSPTIYINNMYEHYKETDNLELVLTDAATMMEKAMREVPDIVPSLDMESAKDNIVFQLVNTEQNKALLEDAPNRAFQDLSIIYRWVVKVEDSGIQSTVVHNSLTKRLGMSEDEMFNAAVENNRRIFPPRIRNMNDVIKDMFMKDGIPPEIAEMMSGEIPPEQSMYVISNEQGINGAISMLYEDKLLGLAENLGTDMSTLPSSLLAVIAVSASMGDPYELAQLVAEITMDQVALDE